MLKALSFYFWLFRELVKEGIVPCGEYKLFKNKSRKQLTLYHAEH